MKQVHFKAPEICLILLIMIYTFVALFRLGSYQVPETGWYSDEKGREIVLDFGEETDIAGFMCYLGNYENRVFSLETGSGIPAIWNQQEDIKLDQVYQWAWVPVGGTCRYVRLTTQKVYTEIKELIFLNRDREPVRPVNLSEYPALFDEETCFAGNPSFMEGTTFDETVYARTAYEYLHGIRSYEDTHPPLGKILVSIGILLFGMNPFGWRFAGAVSGVLMLAVLWRFCRRLCKNPWTSVLVTAIFAADFMHFTQTRLAQVDSFLILFMMGMYYFMYRYGEVILEEPEEGRTQKKKLWRYLALSGSCMGAAVSCKWSGFYGAAGLAVIWLCVTAAAWKREHLTANAVVKICGWCVVFFLVVPLVIYTVSYIPYVAFDPELGFAERVSRNQINMFRYHSGLTQIHPQSSKWFQWPLIGLPVLYSRLIQGDNCELVALLGNPALWFPGIAAFFCAVYEWWESKEAKLGFLIVMFLAPVLPWVLIPRYAFLYHYFPSLPALALMLGLLLERRGKKGMMTLGLIALASVVLFVLFYPIIAGLLVPVEYVQRLQWLPWWDFMS